MNKIYAVKKGRVPGVYSSWKECEMQTKHFSGAIFKSFSADTYEEAYTLATEYIGTSLEIKKEEEPDYIHAYVDGSYYNGFYGSGVVILANGEEITLSEQGHDEELLRMKNVGGEIYAASLAINYALKNNIKKILICHDYEGIRAWCDNSWIATGAALKYRNYFITASKKINIRFKKIAAHTGVKYNELADLLAKSAIGLSDLAKTPTEEIKQQPIHRFSLTEPEPVRVTVGFDINGHPLYEGDKVTCVIRTRKGELIPFKDQKGKNNIGRVSYDSVKKTYFIKFDYYWPGHPFAHTLFTKIS